MGRVVDSVNIIRGKVGNNRVANVMRAATSTVSGSSLLYVELYSISFISVCNVVKPFFPRTIKQTSVPWFCGVIYVRNRQ